MCILPPFRQTVCGGVLRGTGRQAVGAAVDLLGYYLIGLPIAISLMFPLEKQIFGEVFLSF